MFFSFPRFLKCLFRGDIEMYRRWEGIKNKLFLMLYKKYVNDIPYGNAKFSPFDFQLLNEKLPKSEYESLLNILPINGNIDIIESYRLIAFTLVDLFLERLNGDRINNIFIDRMLQFIDGEITKLKEMRKH